MPKSRSRKKPSARSLRGIGISTLAFILTALVSGVVGALFGPTLSDYFAIGVPDIRYTYSQLPEDQRFVVLDHFIDSSGNSIFLASIRLRIKNVAVKQGYIDKAEFVPFDIQSMPQINIQGIDKRAVTWGQEQTIEVRALFTVPVGLTGPPAERKVLELEIKLFDNTGRQVGRYVDGVLARMRIKATGDFTRKFISK